MAMAVKSKAAPRVDFITCCTAGSAGPTSCKTHSVRADAGKLPAHRVKTTRQGTSRCWARLKVPAPLVKAANNKSVPTAKYGLTPKKKIKIGVIKDPPPTPVRPTTRPTKKPAKIKPNSCIRGRS